MHVQDLVSIAYQSKGDREMLLSVTNAVTNREVIHRDLYAPFNEVFDSSQWPAGMYIVLLRNGNSGQVVSSRKLIVTK
jgi:hypothetical protein